MQLQTAKRVGKAAAWGVRADDGATFLGCLFKPGELWWLSVAPVSREFQPHPRRTEVRIQVCTNCLSL